METKERTLSIVVQQWGKSNKTISEKLKEFDSAQLVEEFKGFNVFNEKERSRFLWNIQNQVEKYILENEKHEESNKIELEFVNLWNENNEIEIKSTTMAEILCKIGLGSKEERQFFREVSNGLFKKEKMDNMNSRLFVSLILRLLILIADSNDKEKVSSRTQEITLSFTKKLSNKDIFDEIKSSGLAYKFHSKFPGMNRYQSLVRLEDLVFAEGLLSILATKLSETNMPEDLCILYKKIDEIYKEQKVLDKGKTQNILQENELQSNLIVEQNENHDHLDSIENNFTELRQEESAEIKNAEQGDVAIVQSLEQAINLIQTVIKEAQSKDQGFNSNPSKQEIALSQKLTIAEEEVKRLNIALEIEKEKSKQQEERIFSKLLHAIGGEQGNYLLSDLFEESQGMSVSNPNISIGRLINLFSILSVSIGLEEHTNGHDIGDILLVTKKELIKDYHIDGPVISKSEEVEVKITKYGWIMDGKVIVRPSVTEMKGEL